MKNSPGRVEVPEFNLRAQLQPAPIPNVVTVQAQNPAGAGDNLMRIADSLSVLQGALGSYASAAKQKQDANDPDGILAATLSGKSYEELQAYFASNPKDLEKKKVAMMYGGKAANMFGADLTSGVIMEGWDGKQPLDQYLSGKVAEYGTALQNDELAFAFFNQSAQPYVDREIQNRAQADGKARAVESADLVNTNTSNAVVQVQTEAGAAGASNAPVSRLPVITGTQQGRQPVDMTGMQGVVVDRWSQVQGSFGKQLPIVSGYRDPQRNAKAGGAKGSQHLHGNAIDVDISSLNPAERRKLAETAIAMGFTGVGFGNNSLHLDMRKGKAMWGYGPGGSLPAWASGVAVKFQNGAIKPRQYNVNTAPMAVDAALATMAETPQWSQADGVMKADMKFDFALTRQVKTLDDLNFLEEWLRRPGTDGTPSLIDSSMYSEKSKALLAKSQAEFRTNNETAANEMLKEGMLLAENPNATYAELDQWKTGASKYLTEDQIAAQDRNFVSKQLDRAQKQQAKAENYAGKQMVINKAVTSILTADPSGLHYLTDGATIPSADTVGGTTTMSGEVIKKETVNALKAIAHQQAPGNVAAQTAIMLPQLKKADLEDPTHSAAIGNLIEANPSEKLKVGIDAVDKEALDMIEYLVDAGEDAYLRKITPESGGSFMGVLVAKMNDGIPKEQALRETYAVMTDPKRVPKALADVAKSEEGWDNGKSNVELMDNSLQGGAILDNKLFLAALAGNNIKDPKYRQKLADQIKENYVTIGKAYIPKKIVGWGENTGEDIKAYIEDTVPKIGTKMSPPIEGLDEIALFETADGFAVVDTNTGQFVLNKGPKGSVKPNELFVIRKTDVNKFRKLRSDKVAIENFKETQAADQYQKQLTEAVGDTSVKVIETQYGPRGGTRKVERPATPEEIVKAKQAPKQQEQVKQEAAQVAESNLRDLSDTKLQQRITDVYSGGASSKDERASYNTEALRRIGNKKPTPEQLKLAKERWNLKSDEDAIIRLWANGALK